MFGGLQGQSRLVVDVFRVLWRFLLRAIGAHDISEMVPAELRPVKVIGVGQCFPTEMNEGRLNAVLLAAFEKLGDEIKNADVEVETLQLDVLGSFVLFPKSVKFQASIFALGDVFPMHVRFGFDLQNNGSAIRPKNEDYRLVWV